MTNLMFGMWLLWPLCLVAAAVKRRLARLVGFLMSSCKPASAP